MNYVSSDLKFLFNKYLYSTFFFSSCISCVILHGDKLSYRTSYFKSFNFLKTIEEERNEKDLYWNIACTYITSGLYPLLLLFNMLSFSQIEAAKVC
jgi:hypothetical protein